jgi:nickel-dependent lactate racemase
MGVLSMSNNVVIGEGFTNRELLEDEVQRLVAQALAATKLQDKRVLVIIPDSTRTAKTPLFFRLFYEMLYKQVAALDYLIALGTHPPLSESAQNRLLGITAKERATRYSKINIYNHQWDNPSALSMLGHLSVEETAELSNGMLVLDVPIRVNRLLSDYDFLMTCGPVFPHEVAGFSGGNKYFFPGVSGPEIIHFTHWLGALFTSYSTIGIKRTVVRSVIDQAAALIDKPKLSFCQVMQGDRLLGLYIGSHEQAWSMAADLSARLNILYVDHPFQQVLSVLRLMYDDLWTGAKGMYKLEPIIADGGEVILYAPRLSEISYTHGKLIDQIGYHVRDYFLKQWDKFKDYPWGVLAHSTHLKGIGWYEEGVEKPRIQVTLATGIPPDRCEHVNLGYRDPAAITPQDWAEKEGKGILLVPHAGEVLYRLSKDGPDQSIRPKS